MPLSTAAIKALIDPSTSEVILPLLIIEHPMLGAPIRVVRNKIGQDIVSQGETYQAFPFEFVWVTDTEEIPKAKLVIANADRRIGEAIATINSPARITFMWVLASTPNVVEMRIGWLELRNVSYDAMAVEGELHQGNLGSEPYPSLRVTPGRFLALFR